MMPTLKLATWNVNSLTVRLEQVLAWMEAEEIDILALQETKLLDASHFSDLFQSKGFYTVFSGQKSYNGVAVISRFPIEGVLTEIPQWEDPQRRIMAVNIAGIRLINLYVPNGAALSSDKYQYKLAWLHAVYQWIQKELMVHPAMAVVGDFNIAPMDLDVYDMTYFENEVLVSPPEREAFSRFLSLGLTDSYRHLSPDTVEYSWWDYRAAGFRRNHGVRIDHILLSAPLLSICEKAWIDVEPRRAERPSDHAPMLVALAL
jgi:exodeoxyribonuclease-3